MWIIWVEGGECRSTREWRAHNSETEQQRIDLWSLIRYYCQIRDANWDMLWYSVPLLCNGCVSTELPEYSVDPVLRELEFLPFTNTHLTQDTWCASAPSIHKYTLTLRFLQIISKCSRQLSDSAPFWNHGATKVETVFLMKFDVSRC